jgi:hypothetical protein
MFRHHHPTSGVIALALALAAVAPAGASARYAQDPPPTTSQTQALAAVNPHSRDAANPAVRAIQAQGARVGHELAARDSLTAGPPPPQIIRVSQPNGFDWGDAGIGAAGGVALAMLGLGGALVVMHRPKRARQTTAVPS